MKIALATDSASDIPASKAERLGVAVVPLWVFFGEESLRDRLELDSDGFFARLARRGPHPKTSQPSPADFLDVWRAAAPDGEPVLSVHLSAKLSGTFQSALQAVEMAKEQGLRVLPLDSRQACVGLWAAIERARQIAGAAGSTEAAAKEIEAAAGQIRLYFLLGTTAFLMRGGRMGGGEAPPEPLLNVNTLITLEDGAPRPVERIRGDMKSLKRLAARIEAEAAPESEIYVAHGAAPQLFDNFTSILANARDEKMILKTKIGSITGTHLGPGSLGVAFFAKD